MKASLWTTLVLGCAAMTCSAPTQSEGHAQPSAETPPAWAAHIPPVPRLPSTRALADTCIWRELRPMDGASHWELIVHNRVGEALVVQWNADELWYESWANVGGVHEEIPQQAPRAFELDWIRSDQTSRYRFVFPVRDFRWQARLAFQGATTGQTYWVGAPPLEAGPRGKVLPIEYQVDGYYDRGSLTGFDVRIWHRGGAPTEFPLEGGRVFDRNGWTEIGIAPNWSSEQPFVGGRLFLTVCKLMSGDSDVLVEPFKVVLRPGKELRAIVGRPDDCLPVFLSVDLDGSWRPDPAALRLYVPRGSCREQHWCVDCEAMEPYGIQ